ncbi:hypothetical protein ANN_14641 [Periplaneta americana]|uniref:Uncharacterized protein n=1 Tax=Periplaneta americana TaxID=6978 RepID=A0ABQ8SXZ1_PERAM|nr:hypothetical protein ANN_14641 [Periplaneta americana]
MSVFFFRLHNLRREEESKKRKKANSGSSTSTGGGMQQRRSFSVGRHRYHNALTLGPSRLFERTPLTPSDSLDEIALQIPSDDDDDDDDDDNDENFNEDCDDSGDYNIEDNDNYGDGINRQTANDSKVIPTLAARHVARLFSLLSLYTICPASVDHCLPPRMGKVERGRGRSLAFAVLRFAPVMIMTWMHHDDGVGVDDDNTGDEDDDVDEGDYDVTCH